MPLSPAQIATLKRSRRPIPTGFYTHRRGRTVLPWETWSTPSSIEEVIAGYSELEHESEDYPVLDGGGHYDMGGTAAAAARRSLADMIDRSLGAYPPRLTERFGPIAARSSGVGGLLTADEWVNACLNVKVWRIAGEVNGFSFDLTADAGTHVRFDPDSNPPAEDWIYAHELRSAYATSLSWSDRDIPEEGEPTTGLVNVAIGGTTDDPGRFRFVVNETPSRWVPLPFIQIQIRSTSPGGGEGGIDSVSQFDSVEGEAGTADEDVLFCGQEVIMIVTGFSGPPPSYSLEITPHEFWSETDDWFNYDA